MNFLTFSTAFIQKIRTNRPEQTVYTEIRLLLQEQSDLGVHVLQSITIKLGAQWLSGRVLDSRPKGPGFEPHWRHCVVSLSKNINPNLVLVQPRKTCLFITERLLMGRKESNQTKKKKSLLDCKWRPILFLEYVCSGSFLLALRLLSIR